ncbi:hypothetical protein [Allokutzneria oryzae]|uniref:DUF3817 domain-containing protein n=1 Tax=Allokutzneria oryzae TaxID=1378989 RepID=A0ABV5ZXR4_9PSEU
MTESLLPLRVPATVELTTLVVMLVNIATVHAPAVSSVSGPLHGFAYVMVVVVALLREGTPRRARLVALLPGIGGLLAVREITSRRVR